MIGRSRRFTQVLAITACALMVAGCFGGSDNSSENETKYSTMPKDPGDPVKGGTLVITSPADAKSLDVHKQSSYTTHGVVGTVYSKLVDFKSGPDIPYGINEIEADLAEKWEHSEDGMTWTFHLRKGVKFQNVAPVNGREFTSADVKCTMDRIMEGGFQRYLLAPVASVEYPDDYTVTFTMKNPYATFDKNMANHFMEIVPCEGTSGQYDMNTTAIGTGPFILESWQRDVERVYKAHTEYYEEGKPHLDGVRIVIMTDVQAQSAALRTGKIDYLASGAADQRQIDQIVKEIDGATVRQEHGITQARIFMNQTAAPYDNLKVRQAVALAIDREGMLKAMRPGGLLSGPIPSLLEGGLSPEAVKKMVPYDPEQAKKLLKEAGFPDGFETEMVVTPGYGEIVVQEAQWVQEDLGKVGIKVTLDVQEYATYFTDTWPNKKYAIAYGLQTPMLSADEYLTAEYVSTASRNWYGINGKKLDEMILKQSAILDNDERLDALKEIQEYIIENVSNPAVMYTYDSMTVWAPRVRNYWPAPQYGNREWKDIFVTDGK